MKPLHITYKYWMVPLGSPQGVLSRHRTCLQIHTWRDEGGEIFHFTNVKFETSFKKPSPFMPSFVIPQNKSLHITIAFKETKVDWEERGLKTWLGLVDWFGSVCDFFFKFFWGESLWGVFVVSFFGVFSLFWIIAVGEVFCFLKYVKLICQSE